MKLCLVYTPFCWPTGIPLGIAYLKSYLGINNPSVIVKNLDLNINFFNRDFKHLSKLCEKCHNKLYVDCIPLDLFLNGDNLQKARALFKNETNSFFKKEIYMKNYRLYRSFFDQIQNCYNYLLQPFLEGKNIKDEAFIKELLQPDLDAILTEKPDIIGFSTNTRQIYYSLALAKIIKEKISIPIIFGGYFTSSFDLREIMQTFNFIDFVIYKEGEKGLSDLLGNFSKGEYKDIPNLAYRKNGRVIINREAWIGDLDRIPFPDFSDFHIHTYLSPYLVFPILASRGCYWKKCAFCNHYQNYSKMYRIRSTGNIIKEIEFQQQKYGVKYFLFCDEQISASNLKKISKKLIEKKLKIFYGLSGFRPSADVSYDILKEAYNSGCRWLYFGVESLTQRLLDLMQKGTEVNRVLNIIRLCQKLGIVPFVSLFWGFPTQTMEEVKEEAQLCEKYKDFLRIPNDGSVFLLDRGSDVYTHPKKYKIEIIKKKNVLFETITGKITDSTLSYRVKKGLSPISARQFFTKFINKDLKCELGSFWENLLILSAHKVRLVFPRQYYLEHIFNSLYHKFITIFKQLPYRNNNVNKIKNLIHLGICYERLKKYDCAIKEFLKAQELYGKQNDSEKINFHLGVCYEQNKEYNKALKRYKKTLNLSKGIIDKDVVYSGLTRTYYYLKRYKEAIKVANKIIKSGYGEDIHFILGCCYEKTRQYKKAIKKLREAEKINSEKGEINFLLAKCYRKIRQMKESNRELNKGFHKYKLLEKI